jgi:hypothetical protein
VFRKSDWLERNLADVGIWTFVCGIICFALAAFVELAALSNGVVTASVTLWTIVRYVTSALAEPLMFNGVVLYVLGHLASSWTVAIVGFEYRGERDLRVRGPDDAHTVWVGRAYRNQIEATAAADAIVGRGAKKKP